jgi:Zn-dependent protease
VDLSNLNIPLIAVQFAVLLLALTVHETAHAWTANRFGDPTARMLGRISLNPIPHIDPVGTILFPLIAMIFHAPVLGWAKPVPFNPANLSNPRRMSLWIAAAGPLSNLGLALVFLMALIVVGRSGMVPMSPWVFAVEADLTVSPLVAVLKTGLILNVMLAIFNLLPIPPLDGGGVLRGLLPPRMSETVDSIGRYGIFILYGMLLIRIGGRNLIGWLLLPFLISLQIVFSLAVGA